MSTFCKSWHFKVVLLTSPRLPFNTKDFQELLNDLKLPCPPLHSSSEHFYNIHTDDDVQCHCCLQTWVLYSSSSSTSSRQVERWGAPKPILSNVWVVPECKSLFLTVEVKSWKNPFQIFTTRPMEVTGCLNLGIDFAFLILWVIAIDCFFFVFKALEPKVLEPKSPAATGSGLMYWEEADTSSKKRKKEKILQIKLCRHLKPNLTPDRLKPLREGRPTSLCLT